MFSNYFPLLVFIKTYPERVGYVLLLARNIKGSPWTQKNESDYFTSMRCTITVVVVVTGDRGILKTVHK